MNLLKYIHWPAFIASFCIGLVLVFYQIPQKRSIFVYPTPENEDTLQYQDFAGNCFSFERKTVDCPQDAKLIEQIPLQI